MRKEQLYLILLCVMLQVAAVSVAHGGERSGVHYKNIPKSCSGKPENNLKNNLIIISSLSQIPDLHLGWHWKHSQSIKIEFGFTQGFPCPTLFVSIPQHPVGSQLRSSQHLYVLLMTLKPFKGTNTWKAVHPTVPWLAKQNEGSCGRGSDLQVLPVVNTIISVFLKTQKKEGEFYLWIEDNV